MQRILASFLLCGFFAGGLAAGGIAAGALAADKPTADGLPAGDTKLVFEELWADQPRATLEAVERLALLLNRWLGECRVKLDNPSGMMLTLHRLSDPKNLTLPDEERAVRVTRNFLKRNSVLLGGLTDAELERLVPTYHGNGRLRYQCPEPLEREVRDGIRYRFLYEFRFRVDASGVKTFRMKSGPHPAIRKLTLTPSVEAESQDVQERVLGRTVDIPDEEGGFYSHIVDEDDVADAQLVVVASVKRG